MTRFFKAKGLPERITLEEAPKIANRLLEETFEKAPTIISDITKHLAMAQGKAIRTLLLLNCAADDNGCVNIDAIKTSVAIELFHTATLVHDDIIDDAQLRRGVESIQNKFGKKRAVIAGDYLFCMAFATISDIYEDYTGFTRDFARIVSGVCIGEMNQYKNNSNIDLDTWTYLKIISGKTAALFNISAYAGAVMAKLPEKDCKKLAKYGQYLGMIFQIIDDCKDYELDEQSALKSTQSDLAQGVITLPLILAMQKDSTLKDVVKNVITSNSGIVSPHLIHEVCRLGGTDDSRALAKRYYDKAQKIISNLENEPKKQELSNLLDKALNAANKF